MADLLNNILNQKTQTTPMAQPLPAIRIDLNSQNKIQPLNPKGRLLKSRIVGSPIEYVKDLKTDVIGISKGVRGKANDHELGKMNDLAMKAGSLGLAAYLFAKNPFKLKRTMEFVGFGTFFASMALWPKLAIQAPLKARTGVDIHQKYEDSYGRKKMFFQDPQYIPWDLVSKEELNKMGDKLGVPKDIKNRDEVTKLQAQKIAVQGNTLWMLTAGFAAPIMSALSCNLIERGLLPLQEKSALNKTQSQMDELSEVLNKLFNNSKAYLINDPSIDKEKLKNLNELIKKGEISKSEELLEYVKNNIGDKYSDLSQFVQQEKIKLEATLAEDLKNISSKFKNKEAETALKNYLEKNSSQPLNVTTKKEIIELLSAHNDIDMSKAIESDLFDRIKNVERDIDDSFAKKLFDANAKIFEPLKITVEDLQKSIKTVQGDDVLKIGEDNLSSYSLKVFKQLANDKGLNQRNAMALSKDFKVAFENAVKEHNVPTVADAATEAKNLFKLFDDMLAQRKIVDKYMDARIGDKAETFIANQWGRTNKKILKALGLSDKELAILRLNAQAGNTKNKNVYKIIEDKLNQLAKNPEEYEKALKNITAAVAKYDEVLSDRFKATAAGAAENIGNIHAKNFATKGYESIAQYLVGTNVEKGLTTEYAGTMKNAVKQTVEDRVLGARASFYRMIQTMDLFRHLNNNTFSQSFTELSKMDLSNVTIRELITLFNGGDVKLGDRYELLQTQLEKHSKIKCTFGGPLYEYNQAIDALDCDGKKNWLRDSVQEFISGVIDKNKLQARIKKEMNDEQAKVFAAKVEQYVENYPQISKWKSVSNLLEVLAEPSMLDENITSDVISKLQKNLDQKKIIDKCKKTLLSYTITDHTEKLNDVGPKAYSVILDILFRDKLDDSTAEALNSKKGKIANITENFDKYRKEFISKVANWEYWYKKSHRLDDKTGSFDGMRRHLLVGLSPDELISKAADSAYNTNKWMKMFGTAGAVLLGGTLAAGLLFGKMKKDDVYAGGNK